MPYLVLFYIFFPFSLIQAQDISDEVIKTDFIAYYDFQYIIDTVDIEYLQPESYLLYRHKDQSYFINASIIRRDSLLPNYIERNGNRVVMKKLPSNTTPHSDLRTCKNFSDNYRQVIQPESRRTIYMQEPLSLDWTITEEHEKIGDFNCVLAITNYGGRTYRAWFTTDIPISDGPYVFNGLPGLIVRLRDQDDFYRFDLKKLDTTSKKKIYHRSFIWPNWNKRLSREDFVKVCRKDKNDPKIMMSIIDLSPELRLKIKKRRARRFDLIIEKN